MLGAPTLFLRLDQRVPSGHQVYLDGLSRTEAKADLVRFYEASTLDDAANVRLVKLQQKTLQEKAALQQ